MSAGAPDQFPHGEWARLLGRSWRKTGSTLSGPVDWAGLPSLREAISRHLYALKGIECASNEVVITTGIADALHLIARSLPRPLNKPPSAWVEDPGHAAARHVLRCEGLTPVPVPVDEEGLNVPAAVRLAPDARLALVTPSRQFPLGMPMSLARRIALLAWAEDRGALIVEDEYDSEIRFTGQPLSSLLSIGRPGSVCLIGSLSKLTFPGLRLGYIVGARPLVQRMIVERAKSGALVATTAQPALSEFIDTGGFARHLRNLRLTLARRREALIAELAARLPEQIIIQPQEVGMHLTVTFTEKLRSVVTDVQLSKCGADRRLRLTNLSSHSTSPNSRQGLLLGYGAWNPALLSTAVGSLADLICKVGTAVL